MESKIRLYFVEVNGLFEGTKRIRSNADSLAELQYDLQKQLGLEANTFDMDVFDLHTMERIQINSFHQLENTKYVRIYIKLHSSNPSTNCLALPWKKFPFDFSHGEFKILNQSVYIEQVGNSGKGTGLTIWDGSVVLAKYLEYGLINSLKDANVLELGAGTGLVGIVAGILGAKKVVLSDLSYSLKNCIHNIEMNKELLQSCDIKAIELDWFVTPKKLDMYDLILASDVVWVEELIDPLVRVMKEICLQNQNKIEILMSYQSRSLSADNHLFKSLHDANFEYYEISKNEYHPKFHVDLIRIFKIYLKQE